ncbi:MAG: hypothetical protein DCF15_10220 [Phormidesmis priestleyi]|uniref:Uncharacterized protein n=1 Tax=Phormidesmis priestleyi TaxID=268141 RepID=A0A2W4ZBF6_9CYAN|nr:MAG: hypothetical protein DCF15_10220 [Phormidesmis priestleyi]
MQYLAKVHLKSSLEGTQLQLLAANTYEDIWEVINPAQILFTAEAIAFNEQALVLLDLDSDKKVLAVKEATQWVVDFVAAYLSLGLTPTALLEEAKRAEQWRQSLTLQSQEVRRRALETAARRDEIQDLEKRLKLEKQKE